MSKIDDLRSTYKSITKRVFDKFNESDTTPTKKYLEYFLKMWTRRQNFETNIGSADSLIKYVLKFDELLPYIEFKDIYSSIYNSFGILVETVNDAEEKKEEKLFIREEHIYILKETDDYVMISPKTHKGSLKYGANTRWCTASKVNPGVFDNYIYKGVLVYVINRKTNKLPKFEKIAIYVNNTTNFLLGSLDVFNSEDTRVTEGDLMRGGWTLDNLFEIFSIFRGFATEIARINIARITVQTAIKTLKSFNFDNILESMSVIVKHDTDASVVEFIKLTNELTEKMKKMLLEHKL